MLTIYEAPQGIPRYFVHDDYVAVSAYADFLPVFYIHERTFFTKDGKPVFWLNDDSFDNFLHPVDANQPTRFYFDIFDEDELAQIRNPDLLLEEANRPFGDTPTEKSLLAAKHGRRAIWPANNLPPIKLALPQRPKPKPSLGTRLRNFIGI